MSREPIRVVDLTDGASSEQQFMREVIRAERVGLPSDAKMDELADRLGPIVRPKGGGLLGTSGRWLVATALAGAFVVAIVAVRASRTTDVAPAVGRAAPPSEVHEDVTPQPNAVAEPPAPAERAISVEQLPSAAAPSRPRAPALAATTASACAGEIDLVERADAALRAGNPAGALAMTREYIARCPDGAFAQECERIAVEALTRLGRTAEASARADAFERRYPSSPYVRRIRNLVQQRSGESTP